MFKISKYLVITDVIDENVSPQKQIIYSTRSGRATVLNSNDVKNIQANNITDLSSELMQTLIEQQVIIPKDEDELEFVINENEYTVKDKRTLHHVIQPSANCQLGCHYCGQNHTKDYLNPSMYDDLVDRIETKIKNNSSYKHLSITWYGGEPLMSLNAIRDLSKLLKSLAAKYKLSYEADMITNGLSLKKNVFLELANEMNVNSFQITIDGTAEHHDKRRIIKNGGNTFDIILNNILDITSMEEYKKLQSRITIRCNIDKTNYDSALPLIHLLASHNLQDKIGFYITPIHDWGDNNASEESVSKEFFADLEIDLLIELNKLGFEMGNLLPERKHGVCMVVDKDAEVFDAFGNISTCWEIPYTKMYDNTEYYLGNLKDAPDPYKENIPMRNWNMEIKQGKTWCKTCTFLPVCGGACPQKWSTGTPPCPIFKINIQDRLLLKYVTNKIDLNEKSFTYAN